MTAVNVSQCKVCQSQFRNVIEQLHLNGLSPEKIFEYLSHLTDPNEKAVVQKENIKPSSIRRHLKNHFNSEEGSKIKIAETRARLTQSRNLYNEGVQITIDKVNTISHLIDSAMIRIEELDDHANKREKHSMTINYMNSIKGLVETLGKLTGELKQEGTIDINFFSNEIANFAEIVLQSIRSVDRQLGLNGQLEVTFAQEFGTQWKNFQDRQVRIVNGEIGMMDENKHMNVNTFNENV
ncbi:gp434 [Bacillus phage G]|uniref:Gp434 n=1 Tax=Bacillus phage G TaxID=2884420 RepID=G3MAH5_9CAUD|nr:gp434 [Bacillus phage G]AEO93692.1 gp434 [Bacillus phage G]